MGMQPAGGWTYRELRVQLRLEQKRPGWGQLRLPNNAAWEAFRLPVSRDEVERSLDMVSRASQAYALRKGAADRLDPVRSIGEQLFVALFEGGREGFYWHMQQEADVELQGLRLRLEFDQPELAAMPWEFLHDGRDYLALSVASPVVRSTGLSQKPEPHPSSPGLRLLVLAASGGIADPFGSTCNVQSLVGAFDRLRSRFHDLFDYRLVWNPTPDRLFKEIAGGGFEMLHLVGKAGEGVPGTRLLWLSDQEDRRAAVDGEQLAAALSQQPDLRAVYMNVCSDDSLALELAKSVPALLSLRRPMSETEVPFAETLYAGILAGQPLEVALTQARQEISTSRPGSREWGLPVLYLQAGDGRLFAPPWQDEMRRLASDVTRGVEETSSGESRERRKLQALLTLRRTNLQALEGQALSYNITPPTIQQEIEAQREEIARLEQELQATA